MPIFLASSFTLPALLPNNTSAVEPKFSISFKKVCPLNFPIESDPILALVIVFLNHCPANKSVNCFADWFEAPVPATSIALLKLSGLSFLINLFTKSSVFILFPFNKSSRKFLIVDIFSMSSNCLIVVL